MARTEKRHVVTGVELASSFRRRFLGLMGRRDLSASYLLIPRCGSVHTFFMRGPIDIVFLDDVGRVTAAYSEIRPWCWVVGPPEASAVLELPPGEIERQIIQVEDFVQCQFI